MRPTRCGVLRVPTLCRGGTWPLPCMATPWGVQGSPPTQALPHGSGTSLFSGPVNSRHGGPSSHPDSLTLCSVHYNSQQRFLHCAATHTLSHSSIPWLLRHGLCHCSYNACPRSRCILTSRFALTALSHLHLLSLQGWCEDRFTLHGEPYSMHLHSVNFDGSPARLHAMTSGRGECTWTYTQPLPKTRVRIQLDPAVDGLQVRLVRYVVKPCSQNDEPHCGHAAVTHSIPSLPAPRASPTDK